MKVIEAGKTRATLRQLVSNPLATFRVKILPSYWRRSIYIIHHVYSEIAGFYERKCSHYQFENKRRRRFWKDLTLSLTEKN